MQTHRVIVVAGGNTPPVGGLGAQLASASRDQCPKVIAADSGVHHARTLGLHIDLVVGDLDSADAHDIAAAVADGAVLERFPVAKDKTDLELAIDNAVAMVPPGSHIDVVASVGGRLDHALANVLLLASPVWSDYSIDAWIDRWVISVVRDECRTLATTEGETVTLLAMSADGARVSTHGLAYALDDEVLHTFSSRGVSNVALAAAAEITVHAGVVFVLREWAH